MKEEDKHLDWEQDAPLLAAVKGDGFTVPDNYFQNLSEQVINQARLDAAVRHGQAFETPEGYFESLEDQVFAELSLAHLKDRLLQQDAGFLVPPAYFEESQKSILQSVNKRPVPVAKVLHINFIRYAAAACMLLMTAAGVYMNIQQTNSVSHQLSKVSDADLEDYLQLHTDASDVPALIDNLKGDEVFTMDDTQLSEDEIKDYLELTL